MGGSSGVERVEGVVMEEVRRGSKSICVESTAMEYPSTKAECKESPYDVHNTLLYK